MALTWRLLVLASLLSCATAQKPAPGAAQAESPAATARAGGEERPAAVRLDAFEALYTFDADGRLTFDIHESYEVLSNEPPPDYSSVEMGYHPGYQARPTLEATVTPPNGKPLSLDPATIAEGPAGEDPETFTDFRSVRAPLPGLQRGAQVSEHVRRADTRPLLAGAGRLLRIPLGWPTKLGRLRVVVDVPSSTPLDFRSANLASEPKKETKDGRTRVTLEIEGHPAFEVPEDRMPIADQKLPVLWVSAGGGWDQVAKSYLSVLAPFEKSEKVAEKAKALTAKAVTPEQKLNALLEWVHQAVRYTAVELGDGTIVPRAPDETVARGFGDCKDMSVLLVTALRAVGIEAHVALLDASDLPDLPEELAGFGAFNHAIVRAELAGKPVWVDPTFAVGGAGQLSSLVQGRHALVVAPGTRALTTTPVLTSAENRRVISYEYRLPGHGIGHIKRVEQVTGVGFTYGRQLALSDPAKYDKDMGEAWRRIYAAKGDVKLSHSDPAKLGVPFEQTVEVDSAQAKTSERDALATLAVAVSLEGLEFDVDPKKDESGEVPKRQQRLAWSVPHQTVIDWRIIPPPGFVPVELPADIDVAAGPARFKARYSADAKSVVNVHLELDTGAKVYSAADVEAARAALQAAFDKLHPNVVFDNQALSLMEKGQAKAALDLARELVRNDARSAPAHLVLARALVNARSNGLARAEAKKAVELDPSLAGAHRLYGDLLRRDALGELSNASSRAAVLAEAAEAYRLDPDEVTNARYLAEVYEHDDAWEWYGAKAQLNKAREIYETWREKHDDRALDGEYARLLFETGEYAKLVKLAPELAASDELNALYVASLTMTSNPQSAFTQARRDITDAKALGQAVSGAYARLLGAREYAKGRELITLLAKLNGNEQQFARFATLLGRLQKQPAKQANDARGAVLESYRALCEGNKEKLAGLFEPTPKGKEFDRLVALKSMRREVANAFGLRRMGLDAVMDLLASMPTWSTEKIDGVGELVTMADEFKGQKTLMLVVTVNGKRKLHQGSFDRAQLGVLAFARAQAGDTAAAVKVLELARRMNGEKGAFARLLEKADGDAAVVKLSAAALVLSGSVEATDAALALVEKAFEKESKPKRREQLRDVLVGAYLKREDGERLLALADDFARTEDDEPAEFLRSIALARLERWDEAREQALKVAKRKGNDPEWLSKAAWATARGGKFDQAQSLYEQVIAQKGDDGGALNNAAWFSLFTRVDDRAIERAERANTLAKSSDSARLGTLACLYAHVGRVDDALKVVNRMFEVEDDFEAGHMSRWYVMGRIAEGLGLDDDARRYYARVEHDPKPTDDLFPLAQQRLAAMGKGSGKAVASGVDQPVPSISTKAKAEPAPAAKKAVKKRAPRNAARK